MTNRNLFLFCSGLVYCLLAWKDISAQDATVNLALAASVSTSHVSPWEDLNAVNDGFQPANSSDESHGTYGNWDGEGNYNIWNWVEYEFDRLNQVDSIRVYWWSDGMGISQPTDAYVEYWDCDSFALAGDIGTDLNRYNTLSVDIETNRIRIYMISDRATGIIEFQVYGVEGEPVIINPFIQVNEEDSLQTNKVSVLNGDRVRLSPQISGAEGGTWNWTGPHGYTSTAAEVTIDSVKTEQSGVYTAVYSVDCGIRYIQDFSLTVKPTELGMYSWPKYFPTLDYNFRDEFPDLEMPTQDLDDCPEVVGSQSLGWWTFRWGPKARSIITANAITPMLERMNKDFAYFRDSLGWPPDKRAKNGYRSAIYLYGSGLCTDNADSNALGGWQSSIYYNGESWPMVLISYYPVYSFDPACTYPDREYQMGGVVHEGIHAILADLPGVKNAAWFHEGGNTWLQQEADSRRSGDYSSMGYLNGCTFIAPFMPIECYSGWLQDDSFGGPSAEGVNMYSGGQQICTWRNYLGGNQYGNIFPTFLSQVLGQGSVAWIWRNCPGRVLEGMADTLGDLQMRRLITEYRAKQALVDMGKWTNAIIRLMNNYFTLRVRAEWQPSWLTPPVWIATPYARTTDDGSGMLTPEYRTTPGWSGANQIPLYVTGDTVSVDFYPLGANMTCLLCYRDTAGVAVYGEPVDSGNCSLYLASPPANGVVLAVICNTDYIYEGESTRTAHFDYRIKPVKGVSGMAHIHKRWYAWKEDPENDVPPIQVSDAPGDFYNHHSKKAEILIYPNPVTDVINIEFRDNDFVRRRVEILNLQGMVIYSKTVETGSISIQTEGILEEGIYFARIMASGETETYKIIIR